MIPWTHPHHHVLFSPLHNFPLQPKDNFQLPLISIFNKTHIPMSLSTCTFYTPTTQASLSKATAYREGKDEHRVFVFFFFYKTSIRVPPDTIYPSETSPSPILQLKKSITKEKLPTFPNSFPEPNPIPTSAYARPPTPFLFSMFLLNILLPKHLSF